MCGIAGYVGTEEAGPKILEALRGIEYRGYDSAGIATSCNGHLYILRTQGKIAKLQKAFVLNPLEGNSGIGHTRWATHGKPEARNAHPHLVGKVAVVHNGIIENYLELRKTLEETGAFFLSDTDTEVIPHLVNRNLEMGMGPIEATRTAISLLKGSFALAFIFEEKKNMLIVTRKSMPLVIGFGKGGTSVGSDEIAIAALAERVMYLEDGDFAVLTPQGAEITDHSGIRVRRNIQEIAYQDARPSKGAFRHYMLKEIFEQPTVIGDTVRSFSDPTTHQIILPKLPFDFADISSLTIVACGTASFAGKVAEYWFESLAEISTRCEIASEFRYRGSPCRCDQACIVVSQSGETADTLAALQHMKTQGCPTLAIVNVPGSEMARAAFGVIYTLAGVEISVASTKAFTTQLAVLAMLAIGAAKAKGMLSLEREKALVESLNQLTGDIQAVLKLDSAIREIAKDLVKVSNALYIGRGTSSAIAYEGALKLKEISYIHAEAVPAGELKHGTLALVNEDIPVIAIAPSDHLFDKTASNIQEVVTRGGKVILLSDEKGCSALRKDVWKTIVLPEVDSFLSPIIYAIPLQLLAYHVAVLKGTDVDQPRNLAKSVTTE